MKLTKALAVLDLETTGLDITRDRIIDMAVVKLSPTEAAKEFTWRFNPGIPIPAQATAIHGITDADVKDCPSFGDKAKEVMAALAGCDIAGFNILGFDCQMLWEQLFYSQIEWDLNGVAMVDAGVIMKRMEERSLEAALPFYTGKKHENAHGALADVRATIEVLVRQTDGCGLFVPPDCFGDNGGLDEWRRSLWAKYQPLTTMTVQQLSDFCAVDRDGNRRLDLAGIVVADKDGVARYTHKKVRGVAVKDDTGYGEWILSKDFPMQSKKVLRQILNDIYGQGLGIH